MSEVMQSWKGNQKYSKNIQNYLLGLWLHYVTHAILCGETRSKNNHVDYCLKGKKIRNLRVVTDRLKCIFFRIVGNHEVKSKLENVHMQVNVIISIHYNILTT